MPLSTQNATAVAWRDGATTSKHRVLPEETPVALTYDRIGFAVMMATPADLRDFAIGFSFTEGIIAALSDIEDLEILEVENGIECRMSLNAARGSALDARRRKIAGPVGCGLCGMDSIAQAIRPARKLQSSLRVSASLVADAFRDMEGRQVLNRQSRAVHAAGFVNAASGAMLVREDIGRHNALDKLIGAALCAGEPGDDGMVLLTSRVSIELIQKAAMFGSPILAAISVPTARAVREAEAAGMTLIGIARGDGYEIFTHAEKIV